jgi:hypothetical protein
VPELWTLGHIVNETHFSFFTVADSETGSRGILFSRRRSDVILGSIFRDSRQEWSGIDFWFVGFSVLSATPKASLMIDFLVMTMTWPNTALEPTASPPLAEAFARFGACRFSRRGSAFGR